MSYQNQQIGWKNTSKLLQQISKQLDRLIKVAGTNQTTSTTTTAP